MNTSVGSHSLAAKYTKVPNTLDTRGNDYTLPTFTDADPTALAGKRVLMISADGPELNHKSLVVCLRNNRLVRR